MSQPDVEPRWRIEACRSCGHAIIWGRTEGGRAMPVDAAPTAEGTVLLSQIQGFVCAAVCKGSVLSGARSAGLPLRTSHFATCPDAGKWRKK